MRQRRVVVIVMSGLLVMLIVWNLVNLLLYPGDAVMSLTGLAFWLITLLLITGVSDAPATQRHVLGTTRNLVVVLAVGLLTVAVLATFIAMS